MGMGEDYDMDPPDSYSEDEGDMLDDLDDCGRLNDWATEFVDSMLKRREADPHFWADRLSEKQKAKLRDLWEQYCG